MNFCVSILFSWSLQSRSRGLQDSYEHSSIFVQRKELCALEDCLEQTGIFEIPSESQAFLWTFAGLSVYLSVCLSFTVWASFEECLTVVLVQVKEMLACLQKVPFTQR